jgi:lipoprotein-anchoring transpeptidase ErfK/SrfK
MDAGERERPTMRRAGALLAATLVVLGAAVGGHALGGVVTSGLPGHSRGSHPATVPAAPAPTRPARVRELLTDRSSVAARLAPGIARVTVRSGSGEPVASYGRRGSYGSPTTFLVTARVGDRLRVRLPDRDAQGWIAASDVELQRNPWRVEVDLARRQARVLNDGELHRTLRVAVGAPATPTPTGTFFVTYLVRPPDPGTLYGPYVFGTSASSTVPAVRARFTSTDGQIGLHGTDAPRLLGSAVSNGCVRMTNRAITELAGVLPLGTPVVVRAR